MAMPTASAGVSTVISSASGWEMKPPRSVEREKGEVSSDVGGGSVIVEVATVVVLGVVGSVGTSPVGRGGGGEC